MDVILLERIARLGNMGEIVKVRNGYARNFLIPMKKAMRANEDSKKEFEARRHEIEAENAKSRAEAQVRADKIAGITLVITRQASQEGKLYGSVTIRDISEALAAIGQDVPKSLIVLSTIIKTLGEYPVRLNVHPEVVSTITLKVARIESEAA